MPSPLLTLSLWKDQRVYLNGLPGGAVYASPFGTEGAIHVEGYSSTTPEAIATAQRFFNRYPAPRWQFIKLAGARRDEVTLDEPLPDSPPPPPTLNLMQSFIATIRAAHIQHLTPAARMAGIAFKNGTLSKAELIDRVLSSPEPTIRAVAEFIGQLRAGVKPQGNQAPNDWGLDDPLPLPLPEPNKPASREWEDWITEGLKPYALKTELKREADRLQALAALQQQTAENRYSQAQNRMGNIEGEIQSLRALRPVVVQFPEKPEPIKLEGLQHPQFLDLLLSLRAGLHCMLVGPAGAGKTYSAEQASQALSRKFHMQGAITYAHELLGYIDAHSRYVRTQFRDAFEHGGLILLDEFDASAAEAALVLNAALANGACSFPDGMIRKHPDFLCVIGANTDGSGATMQYAGRARLDGAFLDRFVVFDWQIDPRIEESMAAGNTLWLAAVLAIRAFANQRQILDVVATPRATARGALLQSQGMDKTRILERTCKRGALVECWRDVLALPPVAAFLRG